MHVELEGDRDPGCDGGRGQQPGEMVGPRREKGRAQLSRSRYAHLVDDRDGAFKVLGGPLDAEAELTQDMVVGALGCHGAVISQRCAFNVKLTLAGSD